MNTWFIRYLLICFAFVPLAPSTFALELKSDDLNYTITVPGTWTIKSRNQTGFYIVGIDSQNRKRTVSLAIVPIRAARLDSRYVAKYERVLRKIPNLQLISSRMFTIDGVPAYENIQRLAAGPDAIITVEHQIIADGRLYGLRWEVFGGDATPDSETQAGLASFHFLHVPKISDPFGLGLTVMLVVLVGVIIGGFLAVRSRKA